MGWSDVPTVDIVINSAGIMLIPERTITEDGIEITFATNHIGHYLLTCLIMPKLIKAAENNPKGATRVVNVSSASPMSASMRWSDINFDKKTTDLPETERPDPVMHKQWGVDDVSDWSYIPLEAYNQSKVANVLFSIGITQRLYEKYGILGLAVHPGIIMTELGRSMDPKLIAHIKQWEEQGVIKMKTLGAGASTGLVAALDPKMGPGVPKDDRENYGVYLEDCQINNKAHPLAVATAEAEKLWKRSEELVKEEFAW
jgi:NAD(P)-dependent dehydrogenase (short-subunit alcohol dehydrogenase family)